MGTTIDISNDTGVGSAAMCRSHLVPSPESLLVVRIAPLLPVVVHSSTVRTTEATVQCTVVVL